jgi:UDP-glucose 4-epimerase
VTFVQADVRDASAFETPSTGCDTVFHLAASVGNARSIDDPIQDAQINVLGTLNVLEAARHGGVRTVVYSSSAGIFGELKTLPIREDHPIEPDTPYGASKLCGEKLCLSYAKLYPMDCVCLRYFNVYGVHQRYDAYGNVIPIFAHRLLHGEPFRSTVTASRHAISSTRRTSRTPTCRRRRQPVFRSIQHRQRDAHHDQPSRGTDARR